MTNETRAFLKGAFYRIRRRANDIVSVATLGPAETSSACVANRVVRAVAAADCVHLFETFEEAGTHVIAHAQALLLVPNAYSALNTFHFDQRLRFAGCFVHSIPSYGIACRLEEPVVTPSGEITIITHSAPLSMAKDFLARFSEGRIVLTSSTAAAAEAVADGIANYCVTNAVAAAVHGLRFVTPPRRVVMGWSLFAARRCHDALR
jgi:hypothetical protein